MQMCSSADGLPEGRIVAHYCSRATDVVAMTRSTLRLVVTAKGMIGSARVSSGSCFVPFASVEVGRGDEGDVGRRPHPVRLRPRPRRVRRDGGGDVGGARISSDSGLVSVARVAGGVAAKTTRPRRRSIEGGSCLTYVEGVVTAKAASDARLENGSCLARVVFVVAAEGTAPASRTALARTTHPFGAGRKEQPRYTTCGVRAVRLNSAPRGRYPCCTSWC